jgi:hypothetical protein
MGRSVDYLLDISKLVYIELSKMRYEFDPSDM